MMCEVRTIVQLYAVILQVSCIIAAFLQSYQECEISVHSFPRSERLCLQYTSGVHVEALEDRRDSRDQSQDARMPRWRHPCHETLGAGKEEAH